MTTLLFALRTFRGVVPLTIAMLVLALAAPGCDKPLPERSARFWTFTEYDKDGAHNVGGQPSTEENRGVLDGGTIWQVRGLIDDEAEFGDPAGPQGFAHVHATESGQTYWVQAEEFPFGVQVGVLGNAAELTMWQFYHKISPQASLTFVVTVADLRLIDDNPQVPDGVQCRWHKDESGFGNDSDCLPIMSAWIEYSIEAVTTAPPRRTLFKTSGYAEVNGWHENWSDTEYTLNDAIAPFWDLGDFTVSSSTDFVVLYEKVLRKPIAIHIPLGSVPIKGSDENRFYVKTTVKAASLNMRPSEGGARASFRDPANASGLSFSFEGLEEEPPTLEDPGPGPGLEIPACATGPDPAAGTLSFAAATFAYPELPGHGATIVVTRSGGSKGLVSAAVATGDGTGIAGVNYTAVSTQVLFADGESGSRALRVPIIPNTVEGPDKTVNLTLSDPRGCAALGTQATAVLTILDDDKPISGPSRFTIGGTVSGLQGTGLVLREVLGGEAVTVANDGPFTLSTPRLDGTGYEVRIDRQPTQPLQSCAVTHGTGVLAGADVTNVAVTCTTPAAPGSLDPSFGDSGRVVTSVPYTPALLGPRIGMALQGDGKILLVGGMKLLRLNTNGTLDTTFGTAGVVNVVFDNGALDTAMDVAVQADGKIVVAGTTSTFVVGSDNFALTRFNPEGTLDTTFGTSGHVTTDFFGSTDQVRRMRLQADGKIFVVGFAVHPLTASLSSTVFAVAGYEADGTPDLRFSLEGKTTDSPGNSFSIANGLTIQSDGKIVVAGSTAPSGAEDPDSGFVRYLDDGQVHLPGARDDTFGPMGNGTVEARMIGHDEAVDVVVLGDGSILGAIRFAAGVAPGGIAFGFGLAHVPANGIPPPGVPQPVITFTTQSDSPRAMLEQADGKIVVVGQAGNLGTNPDMAIARFNDSGFALDTSFGTDGKLTVDFFGGIDGAEAVVQQADGKLVVGGFARNGAAGNVFAAVRVEQ